MKIRLKLLAVSLSAIALGLGMIENKASAQDPAQTPTESMPGTTEPSATPTEVSDEELQQFAQAVAAVQQIQQQSESQMIEAVQNAGLTPERFIEIGRSQQTPDAQPPSEITTEEKQSFETARNKVIEIRQTAQSEMEQAIQAEGLEPNRFNEIALAVQQDPSLREQVQQFIQQ